MISKEGWNELKSAEQYGMFVLLTNRVEALEKTFDRNNKDQWKAIADTMEALKECQYKRKI